MPVYNAARFVRQATQSILDQTCSDFELIAIDDGSRDDSSLILGEIAASDSRLRILSRPNTGIVGALNDGIAIARGEFLARIDADDVALPNRFARQLDYMNRHPDCVVLGSAVTIMDQDGEEIVSTDVPTEHEEMEEFLMQGLGALGHSTVMMRAGAVRQVGGYREEFRLAQDMDLFLRLGEIGRLANLPEPLVLYRWHVDSISHRKNQGAALLARATMVREACIRRGIPVRNICPATQQITEKSEKDLLIDHYSRWSYTAAQAHRLRIARKYALAVLWLAPLRKRSWWLFCNSLLGIHTAEMVTRVLRRSKRSKGSRKCDPGTAESHGGRQSTGR